MKKFLKRAPLVSAVIRLNFTELPSLAPMKQEALNTLHSKMIKEGFPEKIESKIESLSINFDASADKMEQNKSSQMRYLFRASGEQEIIELTNNSIILKTTDYHTFNEFYAKFKLLIEVCMSTISDFNNSLLKNINLRYVDVIVPDSTSKLSDYVVEGLIPASLESIIEYKQFLHGVSVKVVDTNIGQLKVHFEELPTNENKIHKILPHDLMEPDPNCSLIIKGQQEWLNVTNESYGILDIDHTHTFLGSPKFDVSLINDITSKLYKDSNDVFWGVITEKAQESWGVTEIDHVEH